MARNQESSDVSNKIPVTLDGVEETLMIPVLARAKESMRPDHFFADQKAVELVNRVDYDFNKLKGKVDKYSQIGAVIRTDLIDNLARRILDQTPNALVLNLGAGLDARYERLKTADCQWVDVDLPPVISLKRKFFEESSQLHFIAGDLFETAWIQQIVNTATWQGRPVLVIAEGVFPYFPADKVRLVLELLSTHFPGTPVIFDCLGTWIVTRYHKSHPTLKKMKDDVALNFGCETAADLRELLPHLQVLEELDYYHSPKYLKRWGFLGRLVGKIPLFRRQFKIWEVRV